jgi:O-succinylbenzoic acid--CoA ligase
LKTLSIRYLCTNDQMKSDIESFLIDWQDSSDTILAFTSGSTGLPKEIVLAKSAMRASAKMTGVHLGLKKGDKALLCLSPATIAGKMMLVRSFELGLKLVVSELTSNPLELIEEQIDFVAMVPMQLDNSISFFPSKLQTIHRVIVGGGSVSDKVIEKLKRQETTVYQTYGMTETVSHIAMRRIGKQTDRFYEALGSTYFTKESDQLVIHTSLNGNLPLVTNDIVHLEDKRHFEWRGRADFIVNSGGIKFQPEELEQKIQHLINVPFFIGGIPDDYLGNKLVLFVESVNTYSIEYKVLRLILDKYACPKEVVVMAQFVRTKSDKINRIESMKLREHYVSKTIL